MEPEQINDLIRAIENSTTSQEQLSTSIGDINLSVDRSIESLGKIEDLSDSMREGSRSQDRLGERLLDMAKILEETANTLVDSMEDLREEINLMIQEYRQGGEV
jgi:methyl-accepting chemotaxis protein